MPATEPTLQPPDAASLIAVSAEVRRIRAAVLFFYVVDAALLLLLGAFGTVAWDVGLWYAVVGCAFSETTFFWFRYRGAHSELLERLGLSLTASTGLVMLVTMARAPQVSGLMLLSITSLLALSAVQLSRRHLLALCLLLAAASVFILSAGPGGAGLPTASAAECIVSTAWVAWLMAKASAHNITGTRLRQQVSRVNAELAEALRRLEKVAAIDELTLLPNRRAILASLERVVAATLRRERPVGIALLDIDRFKLINDGHGHAVGDQVLRDFGQVLALGLRPSDRLGRYGGEEFLLVLQEFADAAAAADVVERLCARIAAHDWSRIAPGLAVRASAGVTLLMPGESGAAAIDRADAALYEAKAGGRDRVVTAAGPVLRADVSVTPAEALAPSAG